MFDLYIYDENGELESISRDILTATYYKSLAKLAVSDCRHSVKVVDQQDGVVVYTLEVIIHKH